MDLSVEIYMGVVGMINSSTFALYSYDTDLSLHAVVD
jgi:hypothetical protein